MDQGFRDLGDEFPDVDRIYLNNASASRMPVSAIRAMGDFLSEYNRVGPDSDAAAVMVEDVARRVRRMVSGMIRCQPDEIALTQSTTDGINAVASGMNVRPGSNVIVRGTDHEHRANILPWLYMRDRAQIRHIPVDQNGFFDFADLEGLLDQDTALVALSHALYNTGAVLPLEEVGGLLDGSPSLFFVDAAQTVGNLGDYDFSRLKCDFMAFNGSKWLCGPMGTGLFYCSRKAAAALKPAHIGAESAITYDGSTQIAFKDMPDRFQTGYRNFAGLAGLAAALECVTRASLERIRLQNARLSGILRDELSQISGVTLYGPPDDRIGLVAFNVAGREPSQVAGSLEKRGIVMAVREMGDEKMVRASPHFYNTQEEMVLAADAVGSL